MSWSFRFARVFGIDLRVHVTFLLALVIGGAKFSAFGVPGALFGATLTLFLFACVVLHELGHSLAARAFGVPTREIVLLPIGGVALLSRMPRQPLQELVIAIAGPFVNVAIAIGLAVVAGVRADALGIAMSGLFEIGRAPSLTLFLAFLFWANVSLVLFNLIPAFPLDGGRMLRALLAFFTDHAQATRIAAAIGQLIAIVLGLFGLLSGNPMLALIALFVFLGAGSESYQSTTNSVLSRLEAGQAYNRHVLRLAPADSVGHAAQLMLTSTQHDFAVMDGDDLVGVITREQLVRALADGKAGVAVAWIVRRDLPRVAANDTLDHVRERLGQLGERVAVVESEGRALGLISLEDIAEAMLLIPHLASEETSADRRNTPPAPPPETPRDDAAARRWI